MSVKFSNELEKEFSIRAYTLMNAKRLIAGKKSFQIVETEVYYFDKKNHPDPYAHKNEIQGMNEKWYFNGFGLDYTFGDSGKGIYAGLLIRGIRSHEGNIYTTGPSSVLKELFKQIDPSLNNQDSFYLETLSSENFYSNEMFQSTRIGLTRKADDENGFFEKNYRFLAGINVEHKFIEKEKVIMKLLLDGNINQSEAEKYLGYKKKAL